MPLSADNIRRPIIILIINHKCYICGVCLILISLLCFSSPRLFTVAGLQHIFIVLSGNYDDFFLNFCSSILGFNKRSHMAKLWASVSFQTLQSRLEPLSSIAQKISFRAKSQQIKNRNTTPSFVFVLTESNYFCSLALF